MKSNSLFGVLVVMLLILPIVSFADTVIRTGESVSISNEDGIVGDFYAFGNVVSMSGLVQGDFVTAAGNLTTNGEVSGDILGAGASVDVHGPVGDDVRVIGGEIIIAEAIAGDVVAVGGNVTILSTASIGGDLVLLAGTAVVEGVVGGEILGRVSELRIDSAITGDVQVSTNQLTLGDNTNIGGTVTYQSPELVQRSPNAVVAGELIRNDSILGAEEKDNGLMRLVLFVLTLTFAALGWYLISKSSLIRVTTAASTFAPKHVLFGLGALLFSPFLILIFLTSMVGMLLGFVLLFAYLLLLLLAVAAIPPVVMQVTNRILGQSLKITSALTILLGAVVTFFVLLIPLLGSLLLFIVFILILGAIIDESYRKFF